MWHLSCRPEIQGEDLEESQRDTCAHGRVTVSPVTFPAGSWRFLMLDVPHCVSAQTYLILSVRIFPTSRMSFYCLALLLHSQGWEQIIPFLLLDFFTYLWIYLPTSSCFPAPPSLSHPSYYNVLQHRNRCHCFHCLLDASYVEMQFLALFFKDYSQLHPGWLRTPAQCSSWCTTCRYTRHAFYLLGLKWKPHL